MIYEIETKNYGKIQKLISGNSHNIFPGCVCKEFNPGWIFADDPENPTSAFVYTKNLGATLVGDYNNKKFSNSLKEHLEDTIFKKLLNENDDIIDIGGDCENWDPIINKIIDNRDVEISNVKRYKFTKQDVNLIIPDNIKIKRITPEILNDAKIENKNNLINDITDWWNTIDNFLTTGFGYLSFSNNEISGWCYSSCILDNRVEIYIETVEKYQNQGIGTALATKMVKHCLENNKRPEWEALSERTYSWRIAEKIGFEFDYQYDIFEIAVR